MSQRAHRLLRDLQSVLLRSLSESDEGRRAIAGLRRAGLSVHLVFENGKDGESLAIPLVLGGADESDARPSFRIGQEDLTILRGLGIDPTRTLRRRR